MEEADWNGRTFDSMKSCRFVMVSNCSAILGINSTMPLISAANEAVVGRYCFGPAAEGVALLVGGFDALGGPDSCSMSSSSSGV